MPNPPWPWDFEWAEPFEPTRRRLSELEERITRRLEELTSRLAEKRDTDRAPKTNLHRPEPTPLTSRSTPLPALERLREERQAVSWMRDRLRRGRVFV